MLEVVSLLISENEARKMRAIRNIRKTAVQICQRYYGGYSVGVPPLPIPNREVKPVRADGTADPRESRSPPAFNQNLHL